MVMLWTALQTQPCWRRLLGLLLAASGAAGSQGPRLLPALLRVRPALL
jgi:hypothetical protein